MFDRSEGMQLSGTADEPDPVLIKSRASENGCGSISKQSIQVHLYAYANERKGPMAYPSKHDLK
jgi:hypothetical protein